MTGALNTTENTPAPEAFGLHMLQPLDEHNQQLQAHTHPANWRNPTPRGRYNMVVIGAGPAGLVTAAAIAGLGGKVALIERGLLGGDCLNVGCVPSKALIRCAHAAAAVRDAPAFGVRVEGEVTVDFPAVMTRMRRLRAKLSHHDSASRFTDLGVDVYLGEARFLGRGAIAVAGQELRFARALIATGARAAAPPMEGSADAGFLTNESLFSLTELPRRLTVIGAGPMGCEMAQAFARFGSQVTLMEAGARIMPRDDEDAAAIVARAMARDGVHIIFGAKITRVDMDGGEKVIRAHSDGHDQQFRADEILVSAGRTPNVESLNLEAAGVKYDARQGVMVNDYLQTTNPRIYAAGDVASMFKFTHTADAMARIVVQNTLFFGRAKVSALTIPWVTYTGPEVAHTGLTPEAAAQRGLAIDTITIGLHEVDRAVLDGEEEGFARIHLRKGSDRILGATIVARHAGEMISGITAAMTLDKGLGSLGKTIHPYPTQAEVIKKIADTANRKRLTPRVKSFLRTLLACRR